MGQTQLLEDIKAIEQSGGPDIDRDTQLPAVGCCGLDPFPVQELTLVGFGAQRVEVDEEVGLGSEKSDVLPLDTRNRRQTRTGLEGRGEFLFEVAADDVLSQGHAREGLGHGIEHRGRETLGPGPQHHL